MTIYVEKPNLNDRKLNINYEGKFTFNDENLGDFNEENRIDFIQKNDVFKNIWISN